MTDEIIGKLRELERYIQQLKEFQSYSYYEIESSLEKTWAIEYGLQASIQIVLDVGNQILASIGVNQLEDYTDILDKLGQCNILPPHFVAQTRGMAGFRKILVHRYDEVDLATVYEVLQSRLGDFTEYIGYIQRYMSSKQ